MLQFCADWSLDVAARRNIQLLLYLVAIFLLPSGLILFGLISTE